MNKINWYDIRNTRQKWRAYNFYIGGRGVGKTHSLIDFCINEQAGHFLYLRNTGVQLDESCGRSFETSFGNPFKKWDKINNRQIFMTSEKEHAVIKEGDQILGFGACLSTFENLRGVDLSDINIIIFDEFIEKRTLPFDQFGNFMQMYETVNRNRELEGEEPVRVFLLSNAQRLSNPILRGLNLIGVIENLQKQGQKSFTQNKIHLELVQSEVSELKKSTGIYDMIQDTAYYKEAIENQFANDSFSGVVKRNIVEYTPLFCIDDIYVWKHKSNGRLYACNTFSPDAKKFNTRDNYIFFMRAFGLKLKLCITSDLVDYSDYTTKSDLLRILKMI